MIGPAVVALTRLRAPSVFVGRGASWRTSMVGERANARDPPVGEGAHVKDAAIAHGTVELWVSRCGRPHALDGERAVPTTGPRSFSRQCPRICGRASGKSELGQAGGDTERY